MGANGNQPQPVDQFNGLRLDLDPSEAGWNNAIDILNVSLDRHGRVRKRDGTEQFTLVAASAAYLRLYSYRGDTNDRLLGSGSGVTNALDSTGAIVATTAAGPFTGFATIGTTTQSLAYLAYGASAVIRTYNGSTFGSPTATVDGAAGTAMPLVSVLGVTPWDNRLVCANGASATAGPNGTVSSWHHLHFSEPGNPQTFNSLNYEILNPGEGEGISAIVSWRELMFVFKRSKYYVFYGTTEKGTAAPNGSMLGTGATLNHHAIRAGVGVNHQAQVVAARDGVYFFCDGVGLFRTTGGEPQLISGHLAPVFEARAASPVTYFQGPADVASATVATLDHRVFVVGAPGEVFSYDLETGMWTYWLVTGLNAAHMVHHTFGSNRARLYFGVTPTSHIGRFNPSATTDSGAAITSWWRSGYHTPGGPGVEVTIRETLLEGAGTVLFEWARDYLSPSAVSIASVAFGSHGRGRNRRSFRGSGLSFRVSNGDTGAWQLNRATPLLRDFRPAGRQT